MPEACLYPAPSHVPASSAPLETHLSNGNHLIGTCTGGVLAIGDHHHQETNSQSSSYHHRFYQANRKSHSKSAPTMGATDSKPSDVKLTQLFEQYKDSKEDAILAEGIEQLCKDLQISPDDFRILVLAWKLQAEQMCRFTRSEFIDGLRAMRCDSIKSIQLRLPELVSELKHNDEQFKNLYRFTFKFGLDASIGERILSTEMAIVLWRLVFTLNEPPILNRWLNFLETHTNIRGIMRDTWNMFLNFSETVGDDLSSYNDSEAWPSLFDDFVEYENDQANQNITKEKDACDGILISHD